MKYIIHIILLLLLSGPIFSQKVIYTTNKNDARLIKYKKDLAEYNKIVKDKKRIKARLDAAETLSEFDDISKEEGFLPSNTIRKIKTTKNQYIDSNIKYEILAECVLEYNNKVARTIFIKITEKPSPIVIFKPIPKELINLKIKETITIKRGDQTKLIIADFKAEDGDSILLYVNSKPLYKGILKNSGHPINLNKGQTEIIIIVKSEGSAPTCTAKVGFENATEFKSIRGLKGDAFKIIIN